ncbi:stability determinant (plasmid) [Pseudomonas yamanorum]|nr:stability determinant [Pseudomonas yamanorum]
MSAKLSPNVSEFETQEQADSYDLWFRARVQESLDDPRPSIPHDEAMAIIEQRLEAKKKARAGS